MSLAPALGRLGAPARGSGNEQIRLAMLDRLVSGSEPEGGVWVAAWHDAATSLADGILGTADAELRSAARHSRMPAGALLKLMPDAAARGQLIERFLAEGIELERLEARAASSGIDRARGAALQAAWDRAEAVARREQDRWHRVVSGVRHWRRSWRPLVIAATILMPLAALLAAWLGGWLPAPGWFDPIGRAFWSVPWP